MKSLPKPAQIYIKAVSVLSFFLLIYFTSAMQFTSSAFYGILFFGSLAILTDILKVQLPRGGYVTVTFAIIYACMLLFGGGAASFVIIIGLVMGKLITKDPSPWYKLIFNCGQYIICIAVTEYLFKATGGTVGRVNVFDIFPLIVSTSGYFLINCAAISLILALVQRMSPWGIWITNLRWALPNMFTLSLLGIMMAGLFDYAGYWGISLFFIPLLLARYIFKSYTDIREIYMNTLTALADALDAKDKYTRGHSERVSEYATLIARSLRLPEDQIETIQHMALLHDVGKIGISDEILCKSERLSNQEFDTIKQHSAIGARIIESILGLRENKGIVLYHHERYNGQGYPAGVAGNEIPLGARIITVADAFDAMTSDRSYRPKMSFERAIKELRDMSGEQFDPQLVEVFIQAIEKQQLANQSCNLAVPASK